MVLRTGISASNTPALSRSRRPWRGRPATALRPAAHGLCHCSRCEARGGCLLLARCYGPPAALAATAFCAAAGVGRLPLVGGLRKPVCHVGLALINLLAIFRSEASRDAFKVSSAQLRAEWRGALLVARSLVLLAGAKGSVGFDFKSSCFVPFCAVCMCGAVKFQISVVVLGRRSSLWSSFCPCRHHRHRRRHRGRRLRRCRRGHGRGRGRPHPRPRRRFWSSSLSSSLVIVVIVVVLIAIRNSPAALAGTAFAAAAEHVQSIPLVRGFWEPLCHVGLASVNLLAGRICNHILCHLAQSVCVAQSILMACLMA